ncbi:restriction endonuclease subunit S, partial [Rodentibacter pneumotropicus]
MSDWKNYSLGEISKNVSRKFDFNTYPNVVFINTGDILNNEFLHSNISNAKNLPGQAKKAIKKGDILYSEIRPGNGRYLLVNKELDNYVVSTKFMVIEPNSEIVLPEFLYLLLISNETTEYFKMIAESRSGTFPQITFDSISNFALDIPNKDIQKEILNVIEPLNEKLKLNTQINQTLEQIAQAIFKSWFVDFDPVRAKANALAQGKTQSEAELAAMQIISGKTPEELTALSQSHPDRYAELKEVARAFPSEFEEVEGFGEVPRGWGYKIADELFDIGIGKTPPIKETEWFTTNSEDIPWISIKDMGNSGVFITESSEYLTPQAVKSFNIRKIPENVVLLSFKLTLGRVSITTCETTNEAIAHFKVTDKSYLTTEYLYLFFKQFDFNSLGSTSSIATAVNSKTIKGIELLVPDQ